jgi:hypothetical protein
MAIQLNQKRSSRKVRKNIDIKQTKFNLGYISTIDNSRRPRESLSDMLNCELVQDSVARPRPPLVRYGEQPDYPVVGRGSYRYGGKRGLLWLFNVEGVGRVYRQEDGGEYIAAGTYDYDITGWTMFAQSKGKVYPFNGTDKLTFINLSDWTITSYTALSTPTAPTSTVSANLSSGTKPYNYYYRVSANNAVGESIASVVSAAVNVNTIREGWGSDTAIAKTATISWTAVTGATSYTLYVGTQAATTNELFTTTGLSYTDDGSLNPNPFKLAPEGNSTEGFVSRWLYNDPKNSQLFGVSTDNKLYYSAAGTGDFSPYNGGGYVSIDESGDTDLNFVSGFRNGKGDPVITASSRGAAGKGILSHVTFDTLTIGDQTITYPNVYPASGQSGTYAPRGTIKAKDSLFYFTGKDVRSTGTSQSIIGILTTLSLGQVIEPDLDKINLEALKNSVGVEYKDRLYWALPVNSDRNNEIWYLDLSRKNAWVLRWTVPADDLWLYEDNDGNTHFCALVNNVVLEFTRNGSMTHHDDGVAWKSRLAYEALVWDDAGITLGNVRNLYAKVLQPKGKINFNATGLTRKGIQQTAGTDSFESTRTNTGIGQWDYSGNYMYGDDVGQINSYGTSVDVLQIKPKGLLGQLSWEIIGDTIGTDYIHSSTTTRGWSSDELIFKAT